MARARFSIGIDLGTTNSALAFVPLLDAAAPEVFLVPQWETPASLVEVATLPSFLFLPEPALAAELRSRSAAGTGAWIVGRLARNKAGETPGRVIHSAKSWMCHHTADRTAPILPWGSEDLAREQKISPVRASALILDYLRGAWNGRFAEAGFAFDDQEITLTVPASFDAAAQRLTLAAAEEAGFPAGVRLLEEPQAAFYCWLDQHNSAPDMPQLASGRSDGPRHVLVIDIGGGTSDFSLFELESPAATAVPEIKRIAVSEHILLGGDNIDLALAHLVEARLTGERGQLSGAQWDHLVAACRDLKERTLSVAGPPDERFSVAVPGRGTSLIAGSRAVALTRAEIEAVLLDGFFPQTDARARPYRTQAALREWGLPYATDSAVTRHLAEFLRDRPQVDAVLFNGGSLHSPLLRERLRAQIGAWQHGFVPLALENAEPDLAVARGAARFGKLVHQQARRIIAGAPRAIFLEVQTPAATNGEAQPALLCILPRGAAAEERFEVVHPALELRTDQPVRFQAFSSTRHASCKAGDVLAWREGDFHPLPPFQTMISTAGLSRSGAGGTMPVRLAASMNELGLLQVTCVSADPAIRQSWPLEFDLRPHDPERGANNGARVGHESSVQLAPNASAAALETARKRIDTVFSRAPRKGEKVSAAALFKELERIFGLPRSEWNAALLRALWPALEARLDGRRLSIDHEEAWLVLAGFVLRPGFGVAHDDRRIDGLWRLHETGLSFPGRRIKSQEYLLWRRVAGGLTRQRQEKLLAAELDKIRSGKPSPELVRMVGSLELIPIATKAELVRSFIETADGLALEKGHGAPYLASLGLLLSRAPLYAGPETVVSPDLVEQAYAAFRNFDWAEPELLEMQNLFLRAARVVGDRNLDVPNHLRKLIAGKLEKSGVAPTRTARIRDFVPLSRSDRASLYGEVLPPGLLIGRPDPVD